MGIRGGRAGAAVLAGLVVFCSGAYAQTEGDLTRALAGVFAAIDRTRGESPGRNLDGSLVWERMSTIDEDRLRISFNGLRYYIAGEGRVAALAGNLEMDAAEDSISGGLTVEGVPTVSSLDFDGYGSEGWRVRVNGRPHDLAGEIPDEAAFFVGQGNVVTAETEAVCLFSIILLLTTGSASGPLEPEMYFDDDEGPPVIMASNPQKTLTIRMMQDGLEIFFSAYKPEDFPWDGSVPVLDGRLVMQDRTTENEERFRINGAIEISGMTFVSSMEFDSGDESAGTIFINGAGYDFREFFNILDLVPWALMF